MLVLISLTAGNHPTRARTVVTVSDRASGSLHPNGNIRQAPCTPSRCTPTDLVEQPLPYVPGPLLSELRFSSITYRHILGAAVVGANDCLWATASSRVAMSNTLFHYAATWRRRTEEETLDRRLGMVIQDRLCTQSGGRGRFYLLRATLAGENSSICSPNRVVLMVE
jgi:hypothetical protein